MDTFIVKGLIVFLLLVTAVYADQEVGILPLKTKVLSSNLTATSVASAIPTTALTGRRSVAICNNSASTVTAYIGASNVSSSNGFPLSSSNPCISLDVSSAVALYAVTASSTADLRVLEAL